MQNRRSPRVPASILGFALAALLCCAGADASRSVAAAARTEPSPTIAPAQAAGQVPLPNKPDSLHFAVIGDNGTGDSEQYKIGQQMAKWHDRFNFPLVVMMGDNIYGSDRPQDFVKKFELPY